MREWANCQGASIPWRVVATMEEGEAHGKAEVARAQEKEKERAKARAIYLSPASSYVLALPMVAFGAQWSSHAFCPAFLPFQESLRECCKFPDFASFGVMTWNLWHLAHFTLSS